MPQENDSSRTQYPQTRDQANAFAAWFRDFVGQFSLAWKLLLDGRVPIMTKFVPFLTTAYILSPVDLIPGMVLGFGQLDDLAILLIGLRLFIDLCPPALVAEYRQAQTLEQVWSPKDGPVIDLEARVPDNEPDEEERVDTIG